MTAWPFHGRVIALVSEDPACDHDLVEEGGELRCQICGATTRSDSTMVTPPARRLGAGVASAH